LYAHLEAPKKNEQIDYNHQDNLLRSWGNYNYRIESGQEQPIQVSDDHVNSPLPPSLPPQSAAPETAPAVSNPSPVTNPTPEPSPIAEQPQVANDEGQTADPAPASGTEFNLVPNQPPVVQSQPTHTENSADTNSMPPTSDFEPTAVEAPVASS